MSNSTETPSVYVGTYHKYNSGSLNGQWIDLEDFDNAEEFYEACSKLHGDEKQPEFMFQDWENIPDAFIGESWVDSEFWTFSHSEAKSAFIDWYGSWDAEAFEESYQGEYSSELEFTYQLIDDTGYLDAIPDTIARYFDYEAFSRDLFINDYHFTDRHVFLNM